MQHIPYFRKNNAKSEASKLLFCYFRKKLYFSDIEQAIAKNL